MGLEKKTWIRSEEINLAAEVAAKNLAHANSTQPLVTPKKSLYSHVVKRVLDIIIASCALIVTSPLNLILAVATKIDVGSPVLYKQQRIGKNQEPFTLIKFRNMTNDRDKNGELLSPDQRVTKLGKIVRKYSLDEFLNFLSVLKGDMSIIGPRPLPIEYINRMSNRHLQRHAVRPGLLCPITQEMKEKYPFPEPFSRYQAQFETDVWYVENISFLTDIKLFGGLVKATFDMRRRTKNAKSASPFLGYDENGYAVSKEHYLDRGASLNEVKRKN